MPGTRSISSGVKIPQQKRSREKFDAMLSAAERLFAEKGIRQTSVSEIVQAAGVSIGAFYQRFENKDAIIHTIFYLLEDELAEVTNALEQASDLDLEGTVALMVSNTMQLFEQKRGVLLAMMLAVQEDPNIRDYVADIRSKMAAIYVDVLSAYKDEIGPRRFKTATAMSSRVLNSYADQYLLWHDHESTDKALKFSVSNGEMVEMIVSYLKRA